MIIGIIGSRSFNDYNMIEKIINKELNNNKELKIVSGGAKGVDTIAVYIAKKLNIDTEVIKPDFSNGYDVMQYHYRNDIIINMSDKIIAFWDGKSKGTKSVIDKCKVKGKQLEVYY